MPGITGLAAGSTTLTTVLNNWADAGIFDYVLPFLLIFAVVYGILSKINILGEKGKNQGVNAVISIAIGLLALQWDLVPQFFSTIFPYTGVGISILLVALILMGLFGFGFGPEGKIASWVMYTFFGLGAIITLVVVFNSFSGLANFGGYYWWSQYGSSIITLIVIIILIAVIIGPKGKGIPHVQAVNHK